MRSLRWQQLYVAQETSVPVIDTQTYSTTYDIPIGEL
jgi:YVTN family beta-propeller protein